MATKESHWPTLFVEQTEFHHGDGQYYNVYVPTAEGEAHPAFLIGRVYPWYESRSQYVGGGYYKSGEKLVDAIIGYAWMIMPRATATFNIPKAMVPKADVVPTVEEAISWCKWYIEEAPR